MFCRIASCLRRARSAGGRSWSAVSAPWREGAGAQDDTVSAFENQDAGLVRTGGTGQWQWQFRIAMGRDAPSYEHAPSPKASSPPSSLSALSSCSKSASVSESESKFCGDGNHSAGTVPR